MPAFHRYYQDDDLHSEADIAKRRAEIESLVLDPAVVGYPFEGQEAPLIEGYLQFICELFGSKSMLQLWKDFLKQDHWSLVSSDPVHPEHLIYKALVNAFLRALVKANHPEVAWQQVKSLNWQEDIETRTWYILLDYPEYICVSGPEMAKALIEKYEYELEKIERALGYQWTGGESGSHIQRIWGHDLDSNIHRITCADFLPFYEAEP